MSTSVKKQRRAARSVLREMTANIAPSTLGSGPLQVSAAALRIQRQNKHNPLPSLKPEMLSRALDAFEHGWLREAVLLWEKMAERDDMISSVKPKREKDVSQLDMQVVITPDSGAEGEAHKATLEKFWKGIRAVNAYDRNERGRFRRLVKQMMTSASYKYAAHHIVWATRPNGDLTATFEFVPLWMFENTTGKLRYLRNLDHRDGEVMDDGEWMVTMGDGLMIACSIGYLAKRSAFNDWLIFSEKFSVPGVLGRTSAKAGSPEAIVMEEAVQAFGHDWVAVITGDDGTHKDPISLVQAQGNPGGMPMPAVIERVDRRIASLFRGADLSSMSSTAGEGTGASLQEKETDILRRDDAETISETLEDVSRMVIEWYYGNGVEPLARVELVVPVQEDAGKVVEAATTLADRGAKVSGSALMDRLNLPQAKDSQDALRPAATGSAAGQTPEPKLQSPPRIQIENAEIPGMDDDLVDEALAPFVAALSADLQPLGKAIADALKSEDWSAAKAGLEKISLNAPELAGDAAALSEALGLALADAWTGDPAEEVENARRNTPQPKGLLGRFVAWTRSREGETSGRKTDPFGRIPSGEKEYLSARDNLARARKAVGWARKNHSAVTGVVWRRGLGRVDLPYGRPGVTQNDYRHGEGLSHLASKHPTDADQLARTLAMGRISPAERDGKIDPAKKLILHKGYMAVVVKKPDEANSWVLTHYYDPTT